MSEMRAPTNSLSPIFRCSDHNAATATAAKPRISAVGSLSLGCVSVCVCQKTLGGRCMVPVGTTLGMTDVEPSLLFREGDRGNMTASLGFK